MRNSLIFRITLKLVMRKFKQCYMKIDFITYSAATNYGAMLQTYALYSFLVSQGHNVETINYIQNRYDSWDYSCLERKE